MSTKGGAQVGDASVQTRDGALLFWKNTCLSYAIDWRGFVSGWTYEDVEVCCRFASFQTWQKVKLRWGYDAPNLAFKPLHVIDVSSGQRSTTTGQREYHCIPRAVEGPSAPVAGYTGLRRVRVRGNRRVAQPERAGRFLTSDMMINDLLAVPGQSAGGPYANCPDDGCPSGSPGSLGPADLRQHRDA